MKLSVIVLLSVFYRHSLSADAFSFRNPRSNVPFLTKQQPKNLRVKCVWTPLGPRSLYLSPGEMESDGSPKIWRDAFFDLPSWILAMVIIVTSPLAAFAVSGGGLDFAGTDISGQNFSNGNYKGKDFTQVIAKATNFAGSNLQGCRFYKAYLVRADFSGSDLRGASLEDTSMDEALLKNAVAVGAYFSNSIVDTKDLENVDFTDAQIPIKTLPLLCERDDVKGTNPVTGAETRESLMCP